MDSSISVLVVFTSISVLVALLGTMDMDSSNSVMSVLVAFTSISVLVEFRTAGFPFGSESAGFPFGSESAGFPFVWVSLLGTTDTDSSNSWAYA